MNVLLATGLYPPEIGGPATYAKLLEERLPKFGIEVSVLPFRCVRSLPPIIRHIAFAWKIARRARRADLIMVQDTVSTGLPALLAAAIMRKKLVVRVPGDYAWEQGAQRFGVRESLDDFQTKTHGPAVGVLRGIQKLVARHADALIAPSDYLRRIILLWGVPEDRVTRIYNGIEVPIETRAPDNMPTAFTAVFAGRLVKWKGVDGLLRVLAKEKAWHAVVIGDGPERESLEKLAHTLGVSERVQFTGQLPRAESLGWVRVGSAFVLNSTYEGLSHQLMEVMSLCVPIVATAIGGNPELVGEDAFLVAPGNDADLHAKLRAIERDPARAQERASRAKERANDFSIDSTVEKTASLLKEILAH